MLLKNSLTDIERLRPTPRTLRKRTIFIHTRSSERENLPITAFHVGSVQWCGASRSYLTSCHPSETRFQPKRSDLTPPSAFRRLCLMRLAASITSPGYG